MTSQNEMMQFLGAQSLISKQFEAENPSQNINITMGPDPLTIDGKALKMAKNFERDLNSLQGRMEMYRSLDTHTTSLTGGKRTATEALLRQSNGSS